MARTPENKSHAERQAGEEKLHGDALDEVVSSAGERSVAAEHDSKNSSAKQSAIPAPEDGSHARSQAAHLGGHPHDHTKPVGDMRKYDAEREPPKEVSRAGKEYRRQ
ncbi:MAG TPA: hypothetical protein VGU25_01855 [Acidobacteriaceae bacterium]|nr:hypothetical protein [Acidobacteriaceae bacterium]